MGEFDGRFDRTQRTQLAAMLTRRELFSRLGMGAGALAIATLLAEEARADAIAVRTPSSLLQRVPHHRARVRRVIYLFQNGGPSQVDLFDPKPELNRQEGKKPGTGFVNDVD